MYRIIQTTWINRVRAKKVRGTPVDVDTVADAISTDGQREMDAKMRLDEVRGALSQLPEEQRAVLLLVSVEGLSYKETAKVLDVPIGTIMSRLARARRHLFRLVSEPAADGKRIDAT